MAESAFVSDMSDGATASEQPSDAWRILTPVERFVLRSDDGQGAMVFGIEADFDGAIDPERFRKCFFHILRSQPMLQCIAVQTDSGMQWQDVSAEGTFEHIVCDRLPEHRELAAIDLSQRPGVLMQLLSASDGHSRMRMFYHHGAIDGQGSITFTTQVTRCYANHLEEDFDSPLVGRTDRIAKRYQYSPPKGESPVGLWEGLRNLWVTVKGRTARLAPQMDQSLAAQQAVKSQADTVVIERQITGENLQGLYQLTRNHQWALNDLMVGITMKTLARSPQVDHRGRYLSILNPVDLREWDDRRAPAYNRFGIAYIRRRPTSFDGPETDWMTSIEEQLSYVRKRGVGAEWCKGLALLDMVPGLKRVIDRTGAFHPTASVTCLSNLLLGRRYGLVSDGQRWRLDGAAIYRMSAYAPLPTTLPLAFAMVNTGDKIWLTLRYRCAYLETGEAASMMDLWCQTCHDTLPQLLLHGKSRCRQMGS